MRLAVLAAVALAASPAAADPGWTDAPAMLDAAIGARADALRACIKNPKDLPRTLSLVATRDRKGRTYVGMPLLGLGIRGPTPEERCLSKAVATITLPPLPEGIDQVALGFTVVPAGAPLAPHDKHFDDWRDPAATIASIIQPHLVELSACDRKPRTVRFTFDRVREPTRIWLPPWQFHSESGDGTTPPREKRVKTCLTKAIRGWSAPVLPREMGGFEVSVRTKP